MLVIYGAGFSKGCRIVNKLSYWTQGIKPWLQ